MSQNIEQSSPKPRIESLSDMIFGLALSIGALSLISKPPGSPAEIRSDILGFALSFIILISVWLRYTSIMSVLPMETAATKFLNTVLLFLVSIEPYFFYLINLGPNPTQYQLANIEYASVLFALDIAGLMAIMGFFTHILTVEEKKLVSQDLIRKYRLLRNSFFLTAALFLISILPQFWTWSIKGTPFRFYFWLVPIGIFWIRRFLEKETQEID
ncbi:MAG: TMEM175 family protein [Candidatus Methanoperedens sp.]|nr:TMEM175 family protein [Candidatus Methanoperedens sp.]